MNNCRVSVICLAYNHGNYIKKCLQSLVNQKTNFDYEIIVHDDASTDDTSKIIKEFEKAYPNKIVPIYQKENKYSKGIKITNNIIYPIVRGEYCSFCEGDDCWCDDNKLQMQYDFMINNLDYSMCTHRVQLMSNDGIQLDKFIGCTSSVDRDFNYDEFLKEYFRFSYLFQTSSYFIKTDVLRKMPSFLDGLNGDMKMMLWSSTSGKIHYINKTMSNYRINVPGSYNDRRKKQNKNVLLGKMLKIVNAYTNLNNYMYNKDLENHIHLLQYECLVLSKFKCYPKEDVKAIKLSVSIKKRLKLRLKHNYFGKIIRKALNRL